MEEEGTKTCPNCKREIPSRNYNIHTVHCARNIKVCHVCKEPVLLAELDDHHEKLHKLLPCKECGEKICGTDLEDHIRDSCAHTMKSCRFCDLDLRRGELPGHERYCGARTEQCSECGEWVMHRYKQLHVDSNHGFVRLDDDPEPVKKTNLVKPLGNRITNGNSSGKAVNLDPSAPKNTNLNCMQREFGQANPANQRNPPSHGASTPVPTTSSFRDSGTIENDLVRAGSSNGAIPRVKRTNDKPQVNKAGEVPDKVTKNLWPRGAVKKRPAPPPPAAHSLPAQRAEQRRDREARERAEQTAINLAQGLPPVLSAAEKLDKLRKMDALQNREVEDKSYKDILQGRVWKTPDVYAGHTVGRAPIDQAELDRQRDGLKNLVPMTPEEFGERFRTLQLGGGRRGGELSGDRRGGELGGVRRGGELGGERQGGELGGERQGGELGGVRRGGELGGERQGGEMIDNRRGGELIDNRRGGELIDNRRGGELIGGRRGDELIDNRRGCELNGDRFSEIKSSLQELRRGLNEVTAPYNQTPVSEASNAARERRPNPPAAAATQAATGAGPEASGAGAGAARAEDDVTLPCEFCDTLVPLDNLVIHQTGCRPDLAQLRPAVAPRWLATTGDVTAPGDVAGDVTAPGDVAADVTGAGQPVIPCEFCTQSLPIELITEHQFRCERESRLLFPD